MWVELEYGLKKKSYGLVMVRMLFIYVCGLLDGIEKGKFFVLDFGGINFWVFLVKIRSGWRLV